jgi:hypothetical protein
MDGKYIFYICPVCFETSPEPRIHHDRVMISCCAGEPGSFLRKPYTTADGRMVSRAPIWYLLSAGLIPGWTPLER